MDDQSNTYEELAKENALLKQRIHELKRLEADRKKIEEALLKSEKQFRTLIESAPEAILVQSEGRLVYANPAMLRFVGSSSLDELIGQDVMEGIAPEYHDKVKERIQFQHETGRPAPPMDIEFMRVDGSRITVETTAVFLQFEGKDAHLVFIRDNTERKRVEQDRERLILELKNALANVKKLTGLLPICASCKKVRDDKGYWEQIELYISSHSEAEFSHSICPTCAKKLYPNFINK